MQSVNQDWLPISLVNTDTKLFSKAVAIKLQKILNNLIKSNCIFK